MSETSSFVRLFVGFVLSAAGAQADCPIELSPPRVVLKYGDRVSVNCSIHESVPPEMMRGMGWEVPIGGTASVNATSLPWTVEKLTEWDINAQCYFNPSDNSPFKQCLKNLIIVIYTFPEIIRINSSSGSDGVMKENEDYNITCEIKDIAPVQYLTVKWYKGDVNVKTETFDNPSKKPVNQLSVYSFTATRQDDGVTFRCEAHLDLGPEGPQYNVSSQEYNITVHFGPDVSCSSSVLLEGETLEKLCNVTGNPKPIVKWLKDKTLTDPTVPLSREYAGQYIIQANGSSHIQKELLVAVLYGPELMCPSTYTGIEYAPHNFTCIVKGYPEPKTAWYKDGEEVEFPEKLMRSDAGQYLITASNNMSRVKVTVEINVIYPPSQIVELEDSEVSLGSTVSLKCSSTGNPRPKYFWNYYRTANVMEENEDGVSRLNIRNATAYNMGSYTCHATNVRGNVSKTARVTVKDAKKECPIEITPDRMVIQYQSKEKQTATCKSTPAGSKNQREIYWKGPPDVEGPTWSVDTNKGWDARPVCSANFTGIGQCEKHLSITLYKTPDSVSIRPVDDVSSVVEFMEERELQLQCNIINVAPAQNLTVRWYSGNETFKPLVTGPMIVSCPSENSANCDVSVIRSPVNVSSTISINLKRKQTEAEFSCEAHLDLGLQGPQAPPNMISSPLNITVYHKPVINITKLPMKIPVFRGYPEELACEAEGHPLPKIQWHYSSDKQPQVNGNTLIVSEAGLYNCSATNNVGSVYHEVEVILKEDYLPLIAGFVAVTVVAISIIFLFIYSIYYKNTRMRHYSLKNPKLNTNNANVAHNGWDMQFPMTKLS